MANDTLPKSELLAILTKTLDGLPEDLVLAGDRHYFFLPYEEKLIRNDTMPPVASLVGDLEDDIAFVRREIDVGVRDPFYTLERCAHLLGFFGRENHVADGVDEQAGARNAIKR